jgi:hypothetical protein
MQVLNVWVLHDQGGKNMDLVVRAKHDCAISTESYAVNRSYRRGVTEKWANIIIDSPSTVLKGTEPLITYVPALCKDPLKRSYCKMIYTPMEKKINGVGCTRKTPL